MPYAYYRRLSPARQSIYRRSDRIDRIDLPHAERLVPLTSPIAAALEDEYRHALESACQALVDEVVRQLRTPPIQVVVLEVRPSDRHGELHGIYLPGDPPYRSRIKLWMRTARQERVVALRTFLRTLLHEVLHHLDYEHFGLEESFHTEGFFKRESSLFRQIMPRHRLPDHDESDPKTTTPPSQ